MTGARFLVSRDVNPYRNLAREEALLLSYEEGARGDVLLLLWQNERTVVIGRNQNAWRECRASQLAREGGRLARRMTGGGAVFHDLGNLNFSFIAPHGLYDVERQLSVVQRAVRSFGIDCAFSGRNDLEADGRKFSGNAFRVAKKAALHHGTLLISADFSLMSRYLQVSAEKLSARGVGSVPSRVVNLSSLCGEVTVSSLSEALYDAFAHEYGHAPREDAEAIVLPEYPALLSRNESWEWNFGAALPFDFQAEKRFSFGELQLCLSLREGHVVEATAYTDSMDVSLAPRLQSALIGCPFTREALSARIPGEIGDWLMTLDL